jgi:hypothetical protein
MHRRNLPLFDAHRASPFGDYVVLGIRQAPAVFQHRQGVISKLNDALELQLGEEVSPWCVCSLPLFRWAHHLN